MADGYKSSKKCDPLIHQVIANYGGDHTLEYFHADKKAREMWEHFMRVEGLREARASYQAWKYVAGESEKWALEHGKTPALATSEADKFHVSKINLDQMDVERDSRWVLSALGSKGSKEEIRANCPSPSAWTLFEYGSNQENRKDVLQLCYKYIRPLVNPDGQKPGEDADEERGLDSLIAKGT